MALKKLGGALLACVLAGPWLAPAAVAQTVLTYSDHQPLEGMRTRFLNDVLFPAIERESEGRLKIEAHWDGEIAKAYDGLAAVSGGNLADMATAVPEYTADELPLHQIFKSFPVGPAGADQVASFRRIYAEIPEFHEEFRANNVIEIFLATGYPVAFFSSDPLKTLDGLAGHKWRTASFWHKAFLASAGATPVTMHWGPEVYNALADRSLDGLMVNIDSGYNLKVHEHAPNVLVSRRLWLGHLYPVVMNRDTWDSLAAKDQDAIRRAAEQSYAQLGEVMDQALDAQIETLKAAGATVRRLEDAEVDTFAKASDFHAAQADWAKEQAGDGVTDAADVIDKVRVILDGATR